MKKIKNKKYIKGEIRIFRTLKTFNIVEFPKVIICGMTFIKK